MYQNHLDCLKIEISWSSLSKLNEFSTADGDLNLQQALSFTPMGT